MVENESIASLRNLCILVVVLFLLKNLAKVASGVIASVIQHGVMKDIRDQLFDKTLHLPISHYNDTRGGEMISLVTNEVATLNAAILPTFVKITRTPIEILSLLLLLLAISPLLTLISFSTTILSVFVVALMRRTIRRYSLRMQSALENITARLQEGFQNIKIVKAFSTEGFEAKRFATETTFYTKSAVKHSIVNNLSGPVSEIISVVAIGVVIFYGGSLTLSGEMAAEELITFLILLFSIMAPVVKLLQIPTEVQRGEVAAERLAATFDADPETSGQLKAPTEITNDISLKNIGFSYVDGIPVLKNLSLTINKGETVALVGPSGGGKSTIIDLMLRLYDPVSGSIEIDGIDIKRVDLVGYRHLYGVVTQEPLLFHDTIASNIAYGDVTLGIDKIESAARIANADQFIKELPNGYDTLVGDRGTRLSGGQRQRIAIARAVAKMPEILLFDEATSSLDGESEALVKEAIEAILVDRTAIVIAHRLSTIQSADRIVVVDKGQIVESGSHKDLLEGEGAYAAMLEKASTTP